MLIFKVPEGGARVTGGVCPNPHPKFKELKAVIGDCLSFLYMTCLCPRYRSSHEDQTVALEKRELLP